MSAPRSRSVAQRRRQRSGLEHCLNGWLVEVENEELIETLDFAIPADDTDEWPKNIHVRVWDASATHEETVVDDSSLPRTPKQMQCQLEVYAVVVKADKRLLLEDVLKALEADDFTHGERQVREALAALVKSDHLNTKEKRGYGRPHWH